MNNFNAKRTNNSSSKNNRRQMSEVAKMLIAAAGLLVGFGIAALVEFLKGG